MKILFINSLYEPHVVGGAETILRSHVNALRGRGVAVAVLTLDPKQGLSSDFVDGVRVWRAGLKNTFWPFGGEKTSGWRRAFWHLADIYNPLMRSSVKDVVRIETPDLVCLHNLTGWSVAVWSELAALGVPVVQVLHDPYLICPRSNMFSKGSPCQQQCLKCRAMRLLHPQLSNQVSAVVGVSSFILDKLERYGYFSAVPHREVIHNARDMGSAWNDGDTKKECSQGQVTFGFIGSLMVSKGIELLLDTFIKHAPIAWRLVVAGAGKLEYEEYLKRKYRHDQVTFIGRVQPDIFFNQVDITVVPSLWEDTFPGVIFESFYFGVPVLGSNRGGIPEMIIDGANGALFDAGEPEGLAVAMNTVASRIGQWRSAAPIIRTSARSYFDLDSWTDKWMALYRRVLSGHHDD
jgi:glycosyltransferase involved in cell wall biosynthesis